MNTSELKSKIGKECWVIDPRSRKQNWEHGEIVAIKWKADNSVDEEVRESISYEVELSKITIPSRGFFKNTGYHRRVTVSGKHIEILEAIQPV